MSLRAIHIFFAALCLALALFLAGLSLARFEGTARWLWAGLALASAVAIAAYGARFVRKTRGVDRS